MRTFVIIYYGGKPPSDYEALAKNLSLWAKWIQSLGDKLVDQGNPFRMGQHVTAKAVEAAPKGEPPSGYAIIKAKNAAEAAKIVQRSPVVAEGGSAMVYEVFNVM